MTSGFIDVFTMEKDSKIYVAGHRGMVGSAIIRELERQGYTNIITRTHKELDLIDQKAVNDIEMSMISLSRRSLNMCSLRRQRLAASRPTSRHWPISCMIT